MEQIYKFKKGAKIHIKEKNKGSFTKWCGGNVTNECIQRGKNSSNPKIRKKATFADNARHFKHKDGGILKGQGGLAFPNMGFINPAMAAIPYMNPNLTIANPSYTNPNSMGGSIVQGYFNNLLNQDQILQMQQQKKLAELEEKKLKAEKQNQMFNKVLDIGSNLLTNYLNNKFNQTMSNQNLAIS